MSDIEIEVFDTPSGGARTWRAGFGRWTFDDFLAEEHHRQYGRPWCIGRGYVDYLIEQGVRADHNVLDFGCGAGRVGVLLIPLLEAGRYFGIDRHRTSLEAFAQYEIPLHALAKYRPRLALSEKVRLEGFGATFDTILDLYVSRHMPEPIGFYEAAAKVLNPGGRIFVPHVPRPTADALASVGLRIAHAQRRPAFLLTNRGNRPWPWRKRWSTTEDYWHILQRT